MNLNLDLRLPASLLVVCCASLVVAGGAFAADGQHDCDPAAQVFAGGAQPNVPVDPKSPEATFRRLIESGKQILGILSYGGMFSPDPGRWVPVPEISTLIRKGRKDAARVLKEVAPQYEYREFFQKWAEMKDDEGVPALVLKNSGQNPPEYTDLYKRLKTESSDWENKYRLLWREREAAQTAKDAAKVKLADQAIFEHVERSWKIRALALELAMWERSGNQFRDLSSLLNRWARWNQDEMDKLAASSGGSAQGATPSPVHPLAPAQGVAQPVDIQALHEAVYETLLGYSLDLIHVNDKIIETANALHPDHANRNGLFREREGIIAKGKQEAKVHLDKLKDEESKRGVIVAGNREQFKHKAFIEAWAEIGLQSTGVPRAQTISSAAEKARKKAQEWRDRYEQLMSARADAEIRSNDAEYERLQKEIVEHDAKGAAIRGRVIELAVMPGCRQSDDPVLFRWLTWKPAYPKVEPKAQPEPKIEPKPDLKPDAKPEIKPEEFSPSKAYDTFIEYGSALLRLNHKIDAAKSEQDPNHVLREQLIEERKALVQKASRESKRILALVGSKKFEHRDYIEAWSDLPAHADHVWRAHSYEYASKELHMRATNLREGFARLEEERNRAEQKGDQAEADKIRNQRDALMIVAPAIRGLAIELALMPEHRHVTDSLVDDWIKWGQAETPSEIYERFVGYGENLLAANKKVKSHSNGLDRVELDFATHQRRELMRKAVTDARAAVARLGNSWFRGRDFIENWAKADEKDDTIGVTKNFHDDYKRFGNMKDVFLSHINTLNNEITQARGGADLTKIARAEAERNALIPDGFRLRGWAVELRLNPAAKYVDYEDLKTWSHWRPLWLGTGSKSEPKPPVMDEETRKKYEAEKAERERREEAERKQREEAERLRQEQERIRRAAELASLREDLRRDDVYGQSLRDSVAFEWVKAQDVEHSAALLLGNPDRLPTEQEAAEFSELARAVAAKGLVIYDADSAAAKIVAEAAGDRGLGITGNPRHAHGFPHLVVISNPYLRMEAFKAARRTISSPDSIAGLGMAVYRELKYVLDTGNLWSQGLRQFDVSLQYPDSQLKLSFPEYGVPTRMHSVQAMAERAVEFYGSPAKAPGSLEFVPERALDSLSEDTRNTIISRARVTVEGEERMKSIPGGAVVFGGAKHEGLYVDLVRGSAHAIARRGIPIATGGSGGFMELANQAAFDAGAESIGIPLGGVVLKNERYVSAAAQTLTLASVGYETRIPLLLHRRQMIVMAPGGTGTMKELATALIAASSTGGARTMRPLVFVGSYYRVLVEWLKSGLFGPLLAERVYIVRQPQDMDPIVDKIESELGTQVHELRSAEAPKPRKKAD